MIFDFLYYSGWTFGCLFLLIFLRMCYKWSLAMRRLAFYKDQGMFVLPGADRFIFGNLFDTLAYKTAIDASDVPLINGTGWLLETI